MADEDKWGLVISFPDQSASFVHGFEAGGIWAKMGMRAAISVTMHDENVELVSQMAERQNYSVEFKDVGNGWIEAVALPGPAPANI